MRQTSTIILLVREEYGEENYEAHHKILWIWACVVAKCNWFLYTDDVTAGWILTNIRHIICLDSAKCFKTHWRTLHSADAQWPKAYLESNPRLFGSKKIKCSAKWDWISVTESKTKGRAPQKQSGIDNKYSKGLEQHHWGTTQCLWWCLCIKFDFEGFAKKHEL